MSRSVTGKQYLVGMFRPIVKPDAGAVGEDVVIMQQEPGGH